MPEITFSEFRDNSSRILSRVEHGERFTVVRGNTPTAEVIPAQRRRYRARAEIAEAVMKLPAIDAAGLRASLDATVNSDVVIDEGGSFVLLDTNVVIDLGTGLDPMSLPDAALYLSGDVVG